MCHTRNNEERQYEKLSLLELSARTGLGADAVPHPVGTGVLSCGKAGGSVKLITHLNLVPRVRMTRAIPLHCPYAFMARTCITLLLGCYFVGIPKDPKVNI